MSHRIRPKVTQFTDAEMEEHKTKFGLHAKTSVFDRKVTFVGSFNLDPRSVNLNTEMGLLVESEALARQVAESIENDMAGGNSWQVVENDRGKLSWLTVRDGVTTDETDTEPMTTAVQREGTRAVTRTGQGSNVKRAEEPVSAKGSRM
jgi:phosphatidylserine/phosphatidylglycerophosphate/cardiolipin synthase-like enzyme